MHRCARGIWQYDRRRISTCVLVGLMLLPPPMNDDAHGSSSVGCWKRGRIISRRAHYTILFVCFHNHVFPSVPAVGHFNESVPRSRLRGQSGKNTDELPLFVRRRRDARSIPSSTNHQLQWQTWLLRNEYQYLFGTKGINIAFDTYMNNIVH